jgi:hypothetical protein
MKTATIFAMATALAVAPTAWGQDDAAPAKQPPRPRNERGARPDRAEPFKLDFAAVGEFWGFDNELYVVTPEVGFTLWDSFDFTVGLPIYSTQDEQGIGGDLNIGVEYGILQEKDSLFGADSAELAVNGQFGIPLGGDYASENYTLTLGGEFGLNWGKVGFSQDFSYLFETGYVFVPTFGGFVDTNVITAKSSLSYDFSDKFVGSVDFVQAYAGDATLYTLGPSVEWQFSKAGSLSLGAGFVVDQENMPYGDLDWTLRAGIGFEF